MQARVLLVLISCSVLRCLCAALRSCSGSNFRNPHTSSADCNGWWPTMVKGGTGIAAKRLHGPSNRRRRPHAARRQSRPLNSSAQTGQSGGRNWLASGAWHRRHSVPTPVSVRLWYLVFIGAVWRGRWAIIEESKRSPPQTHTHTLTMLTLQPDIATVGPSTCWNDKCNSAFSRLVRFLELPTVLHCNCICDRRNTVYNIVSIYWTLYPWKWNAVRDKDIKNN